MGDAITFVVPGPLGQKDRPRANSRGQIYDTAQNRAWEGRIRAAASPFFPRPLIGAVCLQIVAVYTVTPGWPRYLREASQMGPCMAKPDLDNVEKSVMDALNGLAYRDDSLVAEKAARKRYGVREELRVTVQEIGSPAFRDAWARYGWPGTKGKA